MEGRQIIIANGKKSNPKQKHELKQNYVMAYSRGQETAIAAYSLWKKIVAAQQRFDFF